MSCSFSHSAFLAGAVSQEDSSSISVLVTNTNNLGLLCAGFFSVPPVQITLLVLLFSWLRWGESAYLCRSEPNSSPLLSWTVCLGTASRSWNFFYCNLLEGTLWLCDERWFLLTSYRIPPLLPVMEISFLSNGLLCLWLLCESERAVEVTDVVKKNTQVWKQAAKRLLEKSEAKPHSPVAWTTLLYLLLDKATCSKEFTVSIHHLTLNNQLMYLQSAGWQGLKFWFRICYKAPEPMGGFVCSGWCFGSGNASLCLSLSCGIEQCQRQLSKGWGFPELWASFQRVYLQKFAFEEVGLQQESVLCSLGG